MESKKTHKTSQLLLEALRAKQKRNPAYSQRALARDLGVSAVFVSKILTGEKAIPNDRLKTVFKVLDMDSAAQAGFMRATLLNALPNNELKSLAQTSMSLNAKIDLYKKEASTKFSVIRNWYNFAILDYLTCESLNTSEKSIAAYFGITETQVTQSLKGLEKEELIENKNGKWFKKNINTYFPTTKSHTEVREFHKQMIQKAFRELSKTANADFEKRLITGFTVAVAPENLDKAKRMIVDFLGEISNALSDGKCEEVYQCNIQLFPLKDSLR